LDNGSKTKNKEKSISAYLSPHTHLLTSFKKVAAPIKTTECGHHHFHCHECPCNRA